ncbi:GNAT family protein [Rhizobium sp. BG4]|uniref:GNAT family N-acetyltransferase n=1 Tax=Rhizobium sp. BG4 TaxID=2613770 RepID=UPI00193DBFA3|nr:GNAT family protein [Rhizobium sp. BG4]QRM42924.1 GNAT family N-acetyltransferase [Rhizobium sp. BG4]
MKPTLRGERLTLVPLEKQHRDVLLAAAADGNLWDLKVTAVPSAETIDTYIETAIAGREAGTIIPFVTVAGDQVVGSTRFWKLDRVNRNVEIGHTWIGASWQRSFVNTEAKFLMLEYAFEVLDCIRVQFTTDELNERSRRAIVRLGAVEEGIIRNERIMPDGRKRNSVRFSIIDTEWPQVKDQLKARLASA